MFVVVCLAGGWLTGGGGVQYKDARVTRRARQGESQNYSMGVGWGGAVTVCMQVLEPLLLVVWCGTGMYAGSGAAAGGGGGVVWHRFVCRFWSRCCWWCGVAQVCMQALEPLLLVVWCGVAQVCMQILEPLLLVVWAGTGMYAGSGAAAPHRPGRSTIEAA